MSEIDDLLNFDPLMAAEEVTGKSYKEDKDTMHLGFAMHIDKAAAVRTEMSLRDDTFQSSLFSDASRIYRSLGFESIYAVTFKSKWEHGIDEFVVFWRDGILATLESFEDRVNRASIYYNWAANPDVEAWQYVSSGHFLGNTIIGHHDVRVGLRHTLGRMEDAGTFLNPWIERPFLWLVNYSVEDSSDYREVNDFVISQFPDHVREAITPEGLV